MGNSDLASEGSINLDLGCDTEASHEPQPKPEVSRRNRLPHVSKNRIKKRKTSESEDEDFYVSYDAPNSTEKPGESPKYDKHDIFGQHIANNLREMSKEQQIRCTKLVSDTLFEGLMGNLSGESYIHVGRAVQSSYRQHPRDRHAGQHHLPSPANTDYSGLEQGDSKFHNNSFIAENGDE